MAAGKDGGCGRHRGGLGGDARRPDGLTSHRWTVYSYPINGKKLPGYGK